METILDDLARITDKTYLFSSSVLDRMFLKTAPPVVYAATEANLIDLAKIYSEIDFPGMDKFDARIRINGSTVFIKTVDSVEEIPQSRIQPFSFLFDIHRSTFIDRNNAYHTLRDSRIFLSENFSYPFSWREIAELAVLISRYHYELPYNMISMGEPEGPISPEEQRLVVTEILTGKKANIGLQFLMKSGFIKVHWPELTLLDTVEQSKEYHPEGNVWEHTLAALAQRKTMDLSLGLGLLLHDIGKTESRPYEGNQFHQHAQIGSYSAAEFLQQLEFPSEIIENVQFLVRYHMLPGAIDKIPLFKTEHILSSTRFPLLLELFRCDLAASSRNLSKYYNACKSYRRFLKNRKNPFKKKIPYASLLPKSV